MSVVNAAAAAVSPTAATTESVAASPVGSAPSSSSPAFNRRKIPVRAAPATSTTINVTQWRDFMSFLQFSWFSERPIGVVDAVQLDRFFRLV